MPFVQRDRSGTITGVFGCPQPQPNGTIIGAEEVAADHPDLLEFYRRFPPPTPMPALTPAQHRESEQVAKQVDAEIRRMASAISSFTQWFAELETALSALLYVVINNPHSRLGYALYFSPTGFAARASLVDDALQQFVFENSKPPHQDMSEILRLWGRLKRKIDAARDFRNDVAHGATQVLYIRGKPHVVLASPAFDPNRIARKAVKGTIPGHKPGKVFEAGRQLHQTCELVDEVNRIIAAVHAGEHDTWREICLRLELALKT